MYTLSSVAAAVLAVCFATSAPAQNEPREATAALQVNAGGSAADIIGTRVRSADGDDVGEIEDLIIASDARVATAIVSVGGFLDIADKLVAVPYGELRASPDEETFAIPLTNAEIEAAPRYAAHSTAAVQTAPLVDPALTAPPDAEDRREAAAEAERVFSGDDPRVAEGIAENKKAYEDDEQSAPTR